MCCEPFLQWLNVLVTWCPNLKIINGNETQQVECHAIDARLLATDWGAVRFGLSNSSWDGISHCAVDVWCRPLGAMLKWAEIHLKKIELSAAFRFRKVCEVHVESVAKVQTSILERNPATRVQSLAPWVGRSWWDDKKIEKKMTWIGWIDLSKCT